MTAPARVAGPDAESSLVWDDGALVVVDQRQLPHKVELLRLESVDEVIGAIRTLAIRGAPAIGLAGALGVAISAHRHRRADGSCDEPLVRADAEKLATARPTAVNLAWAVRRVLTALEGGPEAVLAEATAMLAEDRATNLRAARRAADLVCDLVPRRPLRVLTHCNTGRLATAAVGTALGAILELHARHLVAEVLVGESRPLLQGARLTAWELDQADVPYRLCVDSAGAAAMARGMVDVVLVGADRIAANGDTANKIGTYGLAVAAARHGVPFVVVAPESSWDPRTAGGEAIEVEERPAAEVIGFGGTAVGPRDARAFNPAFDVTPGELITAVVTEDRVFDPHRDAPAAGRDAARQLATFTREMYTRGWMPGTSGNLSVRTSGDRALITASGRDKGDLTENDVVEVDARTGVPVDPDGPRASAETSIHAAVYRATDAGAVIHVHAPHATAVACRTGGPRTAVLPLSGFELLKGLRLADPSATALPVFANHARVADIADEVAAYVAGHPDGPPGLLIADHGVTAWGADLAQARNHLECLESICQLLLLGARPVWPVADPTAGRDERTDAS
ncbi:S-methyl-5-thioribose-1-phosphate isomerase [Streptomyces sp. SL13]|uniref:Multifunctional fusion protein n=1 Tax=Streptantibioticus silvisoli TaxID=2705255 RepID=A0AA90H9A9_9ACTN|nr:S-methyl-5-thioribose-1-phosphate isomerase [Streptantibioticus silvisoli]MDI5973591.1 S-methyl-5-thioribose-1-phosphate isomerase [Streptantibioticus silvisoli]